MLMGYPRIRSAVFITLIFVSPAWGVTEEPTVEISRLVANLGPDVSIQELQQLRSDPHLAVRLLVDQLKPVKEVEIVAWEQKKYIEAMKVVWSIRALRFLTGVDFLSETEYRFGESGTEDTRNQMLHHHRGAKNEVSFFGVWMSRDAIYFAPVDAQKKIITKWKEWLRCHGDTFIPAEERYYGWYF
ncbi:MAG: hypothetical protein ACXU9L_09220 [Thermodesulfobacteriota bacterium]